MERYLIILQKAEEYVQKIFDKNDDEYLYDLY